MTETAQLWEYVVNGQTFYTPSGAFAYQQDPNANLIYEKEIN